jgi:hypothetical protein
MYVGNCTVIDLTSDTVHVIKRYVKEKRGWNNVLDIEFCGIKF